MSVNNTHWFAYHGALLPRVSPHINITLTPQEQQELLSKSNAYFLRWTSDFDTPKETSFWYVIKDQKESLEDYKSNTRNQIKKALTLCSVSHVNASMIAEHGYPIYKQASIRYKNFTKISLDEFTQQHYTLSNDSHHEFWLLQDKKSAAYIGYAHTLIEGEMCHYSSIKLNPAYLKQYGGYALIYTMNLHYLNERNFAYVNDGARSIAHDTNIQKFLIQKFHFRKAFCTLHITYHKKIRWLIWLLYPFRHLFGYFNTIFMHKIHTLLIQEELRRNDDQSNPL